MMTKIINTLIIFLLILGTSLTAQAPAYKIQVLTIPPNRLIFRTPSQIYLLRSTPLINAEIMVYLNGLLMCRETDYIIQDSAVKFIIPITDPKPIVQIIYW